VVNNFFPFILDDITVEPGRETGAPAECRILYILFIRSRFPGCRLGVGRFLFDKL
jgi:hypothetical protein